MRTAHPRLVVAAATFLSLALLTAACGGDAAPEPAAPPAPTTAAPAGTGTDDGFPVTVEVAGVEVTVAARPQRIVSLSASATEGLFAIGAGPQVVAVDEFSDFPAEAPRTALSGFTANVEALAAYEPDLVVVFYDPGDLVAGLGLAGIPVLVLPAAAVVEDAFAQLLVLGRVTGNVAEAERVVAALTARVEAAIASVPPLVTPLTYFHELDDTLYTVTSATFIGDVYGRLGLVNVADAADPDGSSAGYPQLSAEFLLAADPDLVFLADTRCCGQDAATFAARPGFAGLRAVRDAGVIPLDDDVASRWGPRIVDLLEQVAAVVAERAERPPTAGADAGDRGY
jgi:iron complex transport system substrate-binding protein